MRKRAEFYVEMNGGHIEHPL